MVGTRKASTYGLNQAKALAAQINACGGVTVSGGAAGVDTWALEGALTVNGCAVAVLGCGVEVTYPTANRALFARIQENGCLMSEYLPTEKPKPWYFPARNRIISGLSDGVLVVEAPEKSGALITANDAAESSSDGYRCAEYPRERGLCDCADVLLGGNAEYDLALGSCRGCRYACG